MSDPEMKTKRWKRVEYDRLIAAGFFRPGDAVELLGGHLIVAEPQGSGHFAAVRAAEEALRVAFGHGWEVRGQGPLALDEESEPEPDLAVVPGSVRDDQTGHPSRPALVVEVSESSLALDREHKGSLYTRAGLADYWIVNLPERALEVYRDPGPDPAAPFGWCLPIGPGDRARGGGLPARPARPAHSDRGSAAIGPPLKDLPGVTALPAGAREHGGRFRTAAL